MTTEILLIHIVPPFIVGIFSLAAAIFAWAAAARIKEIHLMVNSRLSELIDAEKRLAFKAGSDEARAAQALKEGKP